jgi:uncharacterized protein (TIGR04255 family)
LDPVIEGTPGGPTNIQFEFLNAPPLPRVWLVATDGRSLLQIQRDRFLYNWKRTSFEDPYPSYDVIIGQFEQWLSRFRAFLDEEGLGQLDFRQYELSYVNQILSANGLEAVGEGAILIDHIRNQTGERFLPEAENYNWRTIYTLPDNQGRLHVLAQTGLLPDAGRALRLDMTARGMPQDPSDEARKRWFGVAHEWITRGFADVTSPVAQRDIWGRTE